MIALLWDFSLIAKSYHLYFSWFGHLQMISGILALLKHSVVQQLKPHIVEELHEMMHTNIFHETFQLNDTSLREPIFRNRYFHSATFREFDRLGACSMRVGTIDRYTYTWALEKNQNILIACIFLS